MLTPGELRRLHVLHEVDGEDVLLSTHEQPSLNQSSKTDSVAAALDTALILHLEIIEKSSLRLHRHGS
ncbi:hypothetical protein FHG87_011366 [Trinorchestia longiramus]|nr:hypothetical protein FHG87_011366 [Trinorchestia longiramus]